MMVVVMVMMGQRGRAERGGWEVRGGCRRGGVQIEVELSGRCQDQVESSFGEVRVGGGACDAAAGGGRPAAADLGGAGEVLTEDGGVVVRGLVQFKQRQRGEGEG